MKFEIIDFHTHPFIDAKNNICNHKEIIEMSADKTLEMCKELGFSKICGSVVELGAADKYEKIIDKIIACNDIALELSDYYKGFYIPGFHIHPDFVEESLNEIKRMDEKGVKLVGEIVPYGDGWSYANENLHELLDEIGKRNMIVNFHTTPQESEAMDEMVKNHPDVIFVAAHPGEKAVVMEHAERGMKYENYYVDVSGTGMFRHGAVKRLIDTIGADRIVFGSDFPTCNPAMFVGGILFDSLIKDSEKELIFSGNAKRILNLK